MKLSEINIRDPFVLPVREEGLYYLYGTTGTTTWEGNPGGFYVYTSNDLADWNGPEACFTPPQGFWADQNFWAPEAHFYRGNYYLFASFKSETINRGSQILRAESPRGPFIPISERPVTPADWGCLDGTLYVDDENRPWMVFCHEWVQVKDGEICALSLSQDLRQAAGEPRLLFLASQAPWVTSYPTEGAYVTDGPFLYRAGNGELLMLWSSFTAEGYAQGLARSRSGNVLGPWEHDQPIFTKDGGHGMLFRTFEGKLMLALHTPNATPHERPIFLQVQEEDGHLNVRLIKESLSL